MKTTYSLRETRSLSMVSAIVFLSILFSVRPVHAGTVKKCNQYDSVSITPTSNTYKVSNNIWNDANGSQCIQVNDANGNFSVVSSTHNKPTNGAPASYTFINKGCHWGACTNNTKSGMPKQVSALLNAASSWSTTQPTSGVYNVVYDLWFNKTSATSGQPDGAELMIWLAYVGNIQPVGSLIASGVSIAGATWNVWGGSNGVNNVISYVRASNAKYVCNLNLKAFTSDAVSRSYVQTSWYLISVEAGFEIWQNGTGLSSNAFSILVE